LVAKFPDLDPNLRILLRRTTEFGAGFSRLPRVLQVAIVAVLEMGRVGLYWFDKDWETISSEIRSFPVAEGYQGYSWGNLLVAKIAGFDEAWEWYIFHAVLTLVVLVLPLVFIRKLTNVGFSIFLVLWALAPVTTTLLLWVGMYDVVTVLGAVLIAFSTRLVGVIPAAVIMSSGNPEQAVVASVAYIFLTFTGPFRERRLLALVAFLTTIAAYVPVRLWASAQEAPSRIDLLGSPLAGVLRLINEWPGSVFWWYGPLWLVVLAFILMQSRWGALWSAAALILIPGVAAFVTTDWHRVFWLVTVIGLILVIRRLVEAMQHSRAGFTVISVAIIALVIFPTVLGGFFFFMATLGSLLGLRS
jgi:hypothetical protein